MEQRSIHELAGRRPGTSDLPQQCSALGVLRLAARRERRRSRERVGMGAPPEQVGAGNVVGVHFLRGTWKIVAAHLATPVKCLKLGGLFFS